MKLKAPKQMQLAIDPARTCACGRERASNRIICPECWLYAPADLRTQFLRGNQGERRAAIVLLIEHARGQGTQRAARRATSTTNH